MHVREYKKEDLNEMIGIWNEIVEEGIAFPQEELLDSETGAAFFASQSYCGVAVADGDEAGTEAEAETAEAAEAAGLIGAAGKSEAAGLIGAAGKSEAAGRILGLYILHPNNVGRCGHICNASYAVRSELRGRHIGEKLILDCLENAKRLGFQVLQFNAVVESNIHARHLYERLGFEQLGTIPGGFRMKDGHYENICPYYHVL